MEWSDIGQFEWIIIEGLVLGFILWQVISVRRLIRKDREMAKSKRKTSAG